MTTYNAAHFYLARRDLAVAVSILSIEVQLREQVMSFTGFRPGAIRAAIDNAKAQAQADLNDAMGLLGEAQAKAAEVPAAIRGVAKAIRKEAEDGLQELAEFSNGGPLLDDEQSPPAKTPLPQVQMIQMTQLDEIPEALKGRGNEACVPVHCSGCDEEFLWPVAKGLTITCPACSGVATFTAFETIHNGQAK